MMVVAAARRGGGGGAWSHQKIQYTQKALVWKPASHMQTESPVNWVSLHNYRPEAMPCSQCENDIHKATTARPFPLTFWAQCLHRQTKKAIPAACTCVQLMLVALTKERNKVGSCTDMNMGRQQT